MIKEEKQKIRERIWKLMEEKEIAKFPLPCYGRIPNFKGAENACKKLKELEVWNKAKVVKIAPDSPLRKAREMALNENKILIMPTPRLKEGFLILQKIKDLSYEASSIKGAFKFGEKAKLHDLPKIDIIVNGSVAVTLDGARLGKGHGFGELEYAISRELGIVTENTPRITIVHEIQIVDKIPMEKNDVPVDFILTPEKIIRTNTPYNKPKGIYWDLIDEKILGEIPILREVKK